MPDLPSGPPLLFNSSVTLPNLPRLSKLQFPPVLMIFILKGCYGDNNTVWLLKLESLTYHCISQGDFEESFVTKV